ncbi:drug/metabolite transporter superfamily protein [Actinidia rufa]|uniref:Drug/metabolite transporter superfamily protein n=1 Tax=Actinidia rufa TaxID=165716 RepID=A0A7J0GX46_9ERIC|nr:drug/metabolite transporter superfamily protein [Actinidia rufa]
MEYAPELQQQTRAVEGREKNPDTDSSITNRLTGPASKHYRWWIRVSVYILFLLAGQSAATLLGRLYYDKGGNSKWMATFVQSSGFPILIPLLYFFSLPPNSATTAATKPPPTSTFVSLYLFFGLLLTGDNLITLPLPAVPILAVVFFRDKMDGLKVIAMLLAIWGSVSYIYQHYLDDSKAIRSSSDNVSSGAGVELC